MSARSGPLEALVQKWEKSQRSDLMYYLRQAYEAGKCGPVRAKCFFCDRVKKCHVLGLSNGFLPNTVQHVFVCPACEKTHVQHE